MNEEERADSGSLEKYYAIAIDHIPLYVRRVEIWEEPQNGKKGEAHPDRGYFCSPRPATRSGLWTFLYQCAYMLHGHSSYPPHRVELEAERYVTEVFKKHGLELPETDLNDEEMSGGFNLRYLSAVNRLAEDIDKGLEVDLWAARELGYTAEALKDLGAKDWQIPEGL